MTQEVIELIEFQKDNVITYAQERGKKHKDLLLTCFGGFIVRHNSDVVLETVSPSAAIEKYNSI